MAPSEQEIRCARAICGSLSTSTENKWKVTCWLDDKYPDVSSPDVLLSNGIDSIAVEIKQLTDGPRFHEFRHSQNSLYTRLAPDRIREFLLIPHPPLRGRLPGAWVRHIRKAIAEQAPEMQVGAEIALRIPRRSTLRHFAGISPGFVSCMHGTGADLHEVIPNTTGFFQLDDRCEPGHQFLSAGARIAFRSEIIKACQACHPEGQVEVQWHEEWKLKRLRDPPAGEGGVHVLGIEFDFLESAAINSVGGAIHGGKRKFKSRRWADTAAVALHAGEQQSELSIAQFRSAIDELTAADVALLDVVFLVDRDRVDRFFG